MITGVSTTTLSQIYKKQSGEYGKILETIASGAKFNKPSDDFISYMRTNTEESAMKSYQRSNEDLARAKEAATTATSVGNSALDSLSELKELASTYASTTDATERKILEQKFNDTRDAMIATFTDNTYGAKKITEDDIVNVSINPNDPTKKMTLSLASVDPTDDIAADKLDIESTDLSANLDAAFASLAKYTATAEGFNSAVNRQMTINQNIMAAKENTISAVRDIDDIAAIGKATALEIRQQASLSMIAQANISQASLVRLFS